MPGGGFFRRHSAIAALSIFMLPGPSMLTMSSEPMARARSRASLSEEYSAERGEPLTRKCSVNFVSTERFIE